MQTLMTLQVVDLDTAYPQTDKCERLYDLHDIGLVYLVRNHRITGQSFARILGEP
jgi:hypothetical protein